MISVTLVTNTLRPIAVSNTPAALAMTMRPVEPTVVLERPSGVVRQADDDSEDGAHCRELEYIGQFSRVRGARDTDRDRCAADAQRERNRHDQQLLPASLPGRVRSNLSATPVGSSGGTFSMPRIIGTQA
jgi:hypothetical protein